MTLKMIPGGTFDAFWITKPDGTVQDCRQMVAAMGADHDRQKFNTTPVGSDDVESELGPRDSTLMIRVMPKESSESGIVSSSEIFGQTEMKVAYLRRKEAWSFSNMKVLRESEPEEYAREAVKTYTLVPVSGNETLKGTKLSSSKDGDGAITAGTTTEVYARK